MNLKVSKTTLIKALETVIAANYAINKEKETNICFIADAYSLTLVGGNDENRARLSMDAEVVEQGDFTLSTTTLDKQLKGFSGSEIEIHSTDSTICFETTRDVESSLRANIKIDASETDLLDDYSDANRVKICSLVADDVASAIAVALLAVDTKSVKEELKNVGLIIDEKGISFAGFSSRKLSRACVSANRFKTNHRFVVPYTASKNAAKLLKKGKSEVVLSAEKNSHGNFIVINNDLCTLWLKVISNEYPAFEQLFDTSKAETKITVNTTIFKKAIAGFAVNKDSVLNFTAETDKLDIKMKDESGRTALSVGATISNNLSFAVNAKTIKEILAAIGTDTTSIYIIGGKIALIASEDGNTEFVSSLIC